MNGLTAMPDDAPSTQERNVLELFGLHGRTIIITGAAGGLGSNFSKACAQAGASVIGIDIVNEPEGGFVQPCVGDAKARYYKVDVMDPAAVENCVQRIAVDCGPIYGCINCAGVIGQTPFHEYAEAQVRDIVNLNLLGSYFTTQSVVRQLLKQRTPGSIIFIASVAGHQSTQLLPVSAYGATKFAVRGLAQQVAVEYAKKGIRCNSISPGPILTEMARKIEEQSPAAFEALKKDIMLGRMANADELNGTVIYLLSDASSFVTGEDIIVDGGQCHM